MLYRYKTAAQPLGSITFSVGVFRRVLSLDFPAPGKFLSREALMLLGNALMLHQRADLVSDLTNALPR